jgi:hypothetical protein
VDADREASVKPARAVLEDSAPLLGDRRLKERFGLAGLQFRTVKEGDRFVKDAEVAGHLDIMSDRERQPDAIVGDARANALSRRRKPPMLHVAGHELARRRAHQMLPRQRRLRHYQRHHVLDLIAKAVRATRLVEGRSSPYAARQRLIQQPSIEHDVHRAVGSLDLNRAEQAVPVMRDSGQHRVEVRFAIFFDRGNRVRLGRSLAEKENNLGRRVGPERQRGLQRRAWIHRGSRSGGQRFA